MWPPRVTTTSSSARDVRRNASEPRHVVGVTLIPSRCIVSEPSAGIVEHKGPAADTGLSSPEKSSRFVSAYGTRVHMAVLSRRHTTAPALPTRWSTTWRLGPEQRSGTSPSARTVHAELRHDNVSARAPWRRHDWDADRGSQSSLP